VIKDWISQPFCGTITQFLDNFNDESNIIDALPNLMT
jgi:hypothetical protein